LGAGRDRDISSCLGESNSKVIAKRVGGAKYFSYIYDVNRDKN